MRSSYSKARLPAQRNLTFDTDHRGQFRDLLRKPRHFRSVNDLAHILISARRFLSDAALRRAFHNDATPLQLVDDLPSAPVPKRLMTAHLPPCTVAGRGK